MEDLKNILSTIMVEEEGTIRSFIAQEALKEKHNIPLFFNELGCACGVIESLIDHFDIYSFYNENCREISHTFIKYTNEHEGFKLIGSDLNTIVWSAVEKVASEMARYDLGLYI